MENLQVQYLEEKKKFDKLLKDSEEIVKTTTALIEMHKVESSLQHLYQQIQVSKETFYSQFKNKIKKTKESLEEIENNLVILSIRLEKLEEEKEWDRLIRDCFFFQ